MNNNKKYIKVIKALVMLALYFFSDIFKVIPCSILNINMAKISNKTALALSLFQYVVLILIIVLLYRKDLMNYFDDFKENYKKDLDIGFKYWLIGIIIMIITNILITRLFPLSKARNENLVQGLIKSSPVIALICTSIGAPIVEEITFRKTFRDLFTNNYLFMIASALVFGLLHVVFSYNNVYDFLYVIPYGTLGFMFALMYVKTNNLYTSMSMHFIHNFTLTMLSIISLGL